MNMKIAVYPQFRDLTKEDKPVLDSAFKNDQPQISEFTFTNLYSWRKAYQLRISEYDGCIIVLADLLNGRRFLAPIGRGNKREVMEKVMTDFKSAFMRIPEETKILFDNDSHFNIEDDPDNSDYVYLAEDLIKLPGRKYDGKRNLIRKFKSAYEYEYIAFDASNIGRCLKFEERWCTIKDCESTGGLNNERGAIKEMVDNFSDFRLIAGGIGIRNEICAVAIAEPLNADTLVMHVLKADPDIPGLYQTAMNDFLIRNASQFRHVNLEQDLGIEGLRKSKLSYHPEKIIKKYTISIDEKKNL